MEESPSNRRGVAIRSDNGTRQLVGVLPVVTSDLKELIEDPIVQRDLMMTKLFEEVTGSDSVPKQVVVSIVMIFAGFLPFSF